MPTPISTDDFILDPRLTKDAEGDEEMTLSEVGTEDQDLNDTLEKEGMDLNTIVEKWRQKGGDHLPKEEIDTVKFLFLSR